MLARLGNQYIRRYISCSTISQSASETSSVQSQPAYVTNNPKLKRNTGERDITNLDILEERIRGRAKTRTVKIGGQTQHWEYRSEIVGKLGLDNNHRNIWVAYAFIIIFGFGAFVYVKSQVVLNRKEEMEERERIRKSLKLIGSDRKKIGIVEG